MATQKKARPPLHERAVGKLITLRVDHTHITADGLDREVLEGVETITFHLNASPIPYDLLLHFIQEMEPDCMDDERDQLVDRLSRVWDRWSTERILLDRIERTY